MHIDSKMKTNAFISCDNVYNCVCVPIHAVAHVCICVLACMWLPQYTFTHMYVFVYPHVCACLSIHLCTCMYLCVRVCMCIHTHVLTCVYICVDICMYVFTSIQMYVCLKYLCMHLCMCNPKIKTYLFLLFRWQFF